MWARKFLSVFGVFHFGKACEPCNRNISVLTLISVRIVCCIEVACREYRELWKNDAKASWWNCAGCFAVAIFICFRINFFSLLCPHFLPFAALVIVVGGTVVDHRHAANFSFVYFFFCSVPYLFHLIFSPEPFTLVILFAA